MSSTDSTDSSTAGSSLPWLQAGDTESLVIFRALQLGDMLCAVPALRALRAALPATRITLVGLPWATQFAARFERYIDEFIAFPGHAALPEQAVREELLPDFYAGMRTRHFCKALQLHGSGQASNGIVGAFGARAMAGFCPEVSHGTDGHCFFSYPDTGPEPLRLLNLTNQLGAPTLGTGLEFPLTEADERELAASGVAAGLEPNSYICIHPGARTSAKCWPAQRFAQVADQLCAQFKLRAVLTGTAAEASLTQAVASHMQHQAIDAAAPLSIGAMAMLMSRSRLLISNDTGVSHIAAGLGLASVVIFSKADIRRWAPLNRHLHRTLWDPQGALADVVLDQASALLAEPSPAGHMLYGLASR